MPPAITLTDVIQTCADNGIGATKDAAQRIVDADDPHGLLSIVLDTTDTGELITIAGLDTLDSDGITPAATPAEPSAAEPDATAEQSRDERESGASNDRDDSEPPEPAPATAVAETNTNSSRESGMLSTTETPGPRDLSRNNLLASTEAVVIEPRDTIASEGVRYTEASGWITGETPVDRWPECFETVLCSTPLPDSIPRSTDQRSVSIEGDITGQSRTTGTIEDFSRLFRDRYKRLQSLLKKRMPPTSPIDTLDNRRRAGTTVGIIGLVNEVRTTRKGNRLLELEDTTGTMRVVFTDEQVQDQTQRIVTDEVVGVCGQLADDCGIIFGDELFFPDIPPIRRSNTADRPVRAVLLSDLHFGAVDFAADEWKRFVTWMRTDEAAADIEYVLIAGDLAEGIGVYPGQEKELGVVDIYDQYVLCAEALKQLPADVDIYTIMGNHDTVRLAEPQPILKEALREPFADNVHFAGNPALITVEGVKFKLYHGMSLNPFTDRVPGLDIHEPTGAMKLMLEKRHLAPMYGQNVRLSPEHEDYLVLDDVPDVLHTGHVHTFGIDSYKNVLMVNTGCWQYQTDFQRKLNVMPDVGYAPVIDLQTLEVSVEQF